MVLIAIAVLSPEMAISIVSGNVITVVSTPTLYWIYSNSNLTTLSLITVMAGVLMFW